MGLMKAIDEQKSWFEIVSVDDDNEPWNSLDRKKTAHVQVGSGAVIKINLLYSVSDRNRCVVVDAHADQDVDQRIIDSVSHQLWPQPADACLMMVGYDARRKGLDYLQVIRHVARREVEVGWQKAINEALHSVMLSTPQNRSI